MIESLKFLAPPGELDRRQRRFRGSRDDIAHGIVNIEQGIERGPQDDRPMQPDQIAVAFRFSDR
jgi:hypothetical protein